MGISLSELIIVFTVLLVLFGPEQLPAIARQFGRVMGELKKASDSVRKEFYNSVYTPAQEVKRGLIGDDLLGQSGAASAAKTKKIPTPVGSTPSPDPRRFAKTESATPAETINSESTHTATAVIDQPVSEEPLP